MMTEEKLAVVSLMTDPIVEEIKLTLDVEPDTVCFTAETFYGLFDAHNVSKLAQRYKLSEAGLQ